MPLETPVAFFIYKRPDLTRDVFTAIAQAQPKVLLIIADGPKNSREAERCRATRAVVERVDWNCDVRQSVAMDNLGCRQRLSSGLEWVFSQADEAIILEDDCLPDPSFFRFCEALLDRYRYDDRVMEIAGSNWQLGRSRTEFSYYFSKHSHTWGWATWKRAWQQYDEKLALWPELKDTAQWACMWDDERQKAYWETILDGVYQRDIDTWDYQWQFAMWRNNGLSAVPNVNLVSNIGFGREATHTTRSRHPLAGLARHSLTDIRHSPSVSCHEEADRFLFEEFLWETSWKRFGRRVKQELRRMIP
jgi:hypothetical protein